MSSPAGEGDKAETDKPTAWQQGAARFTSKRYSEYFDPCQEAADRSLKCLRRNGGDRAMCQDYFDAYKECKESWMKERQEWKREQKRKNGSWF